MFNFGKIREIFNRSARLNEQPRPEAISPLDLPPLSYEEPEYSDLDKQHAFEKFMVICTQERVEQIADELFINQVRYCHPMRELTDLIATFENSPTQEHENAMSQFTGGAIRRRDSEFLKLVAEEIYLPETNNPRFIQKLDEIAEGQAKPALRVV